MEPYQAADLALSQLDTSEHLTISEPPHEYTRFICIHCGKPVDVPKFCGNRFCAVCCKRQRLRAKKRLQFLIDSQLSKPKYGLKLLTLTIPNVLDLKAGIASIIASFRKLRNRSAFKKHVDGGAYVVEITSKENGWHVHIHAIIFARYWDKCLISALWAKCSPGFIIDIRALFGSQICSYLTGYLSKSSLSLDQQLIASEALKNCRMISPFGSWHKTAKGFVIPVTLCSFCGKSGFIPEFLIKLEGFVPSDSVLWNSV